MNEPLSVGDKVYLARGEQTITAEVIDVYEDGGFSVEWTYGKNQFAPNRPAHWNARYLADGTNYFPWHPWLFTGQKVVIKETDSCA